MGRSMQDAGRNSTGPRPYAFTKVHGWSALGFPGQGWISQFKPKRVGLYLRDVQREDTVGEAGENVTHRDCRGGDMRNLNLLVILQAVIYSLG